MDTHTDHEGRAGADLIHRATTGGTIIIEAPSGERVRLEPLPEHAEDRVPGLLKRQDQGACTAVRANERRRVEALVWRRPVRVLLDTHVLVWWLTDAADLPTGMRLLIKDRQNTAFVSAASCWEIAIKVRSGKWSEAGGLAPGIADVLNRTRLTPLPVTVQHAERAGLLDIDPHGPVRSTVGCTSLG